MKKQTSFFKREKTVTYTQTQVEKGIAEYCCKEMEIASNPFKTKEKGRFDKKPIYADSNIYDKEKNTIGINTHKWSDIWSYDYGYNYCNFVEFKYCPFCGTKINGYVD